MKYSIAPDYHSPGIGEAPCCGRPYPRSISSPPITGCLDIDYGAKAAAYVDAFMAAINWANVGHAYGGLR
jgi:hypothetical protein